MLVESFVSCLPPHMARYLLDDKDLKRLHYNFKYDGEAISVTAESLKTSMA